jgi:hypothetical protein
VTGTTPPATTTNLFSISDYELRESGSNGGSVSVSKLKVGTSFDAVFPSLHIQASGGNAILAWSDPTPGHRDQALKYENKINVAATARPLH